MKIQRFLAPPSSETFTIKPIRQLVKHYLHKSKISVDPFARNNRWATYTNDLNPETAAEYHLDARDFLKHLHTLGVKADLIIFDPPYSPRQISECYQGIGRTVTMKDTQNAVLFAECKDDMNRIADLDCVVICCGWGSAGMGINRNYQMTEILLVCHGAGRNDTIVTVERKLEVSAGLFEFSET